MDAGLETMKGTKMSAAKEGGTIQGVPRGKGSHEGE